MLKRFLQMFQRKQKEQEKLPIEDLDKLMAQLSRDANEVKRVLKSLATKDTSAADNAHNIKNAKKQISARQELDQYLGTVERGTQIQAKLTRELQVAQNQPASPNAQLNHRAIIKINEKALEIMSEYLKKLAPFAKSYGREDILKDAHDYILSRRSENERNGKRIILSVNEVYEVLQAAAEQLRKAAIENSTHKDGRDSPTTSSSSSEQMISRQNSVSSMRGDRDDDHRHGPMSHT